MRYAIVTLISFVLSSFVISNTYYKKKQFYPTVVYLTNHQPCLAILLFQCVVLLFLLVKALTYAFFGRLQRAEVDNLVSQSWYAFFDMCLVFAFFQDELGTEFLFLFFILLFIRAFHWLIDERVDYMERTPVINALFHIRILSLILALGLIDGYFVKTAYWKPVVRGLSVHLALGIEYFILMLGLFSTTVRYILHSIDSMREHSWDKKTTYLLYVDIIVGFIRLAIYIEFTFIMWSLHPFPLFIARPIYLSVRTLKKAIRDVLMSRRAIRYMNTVFRDATPADLNASSDAVCIICREEMHLPTENVQQSQHSTLKKLPCSHIFHVVCLRSWFQRQQTCPTCRMDVIRQARQQELQRQQPRRAGAAAAPTETTPSSSTASSSGSQTAPFTTPASNQNAQMPWAPPANSFSFYSPFWPPTCGTSTSTTTATTTINATAISTGSNSQMQTGYQALPPPFLMPPFMGMPIIYPGNLFPTSNSPMPEPPTSVPDLADEARLRASAEARFTALRQINLLLNAAVLQMNAYLNAASTPLNQGSSEQTLQAPSKTVSDEDLILDTKLDEIPTIEQTDEALESEKDTNSVGADTEVPERSELRKRRLEHFCNSGKSELEQSSEELHVEAN